jgi:hypothetical protein
MGSPLPHPPVAQMDHNYGQTLPHPSLYPNIISHPTGHNMRYVLPITDSRVMSYGNSKSPYIYD